ncbi:MAG TPA: SusC/RagA family TonB-linked outer membrane protein [Gemmatimonadales bacterium]|jgi:iron complex outermembrane receptor protein|nr:SusC/RagA family TonB-linked outer membrane protein [Gemmatimonadales bacterium]
MKPLRYLIVALLAVLCLAPLRAEAQSGTIRGRVTDAVSQQPLAGVAVSFGSRSTQSRQDGQYVMTGVPAGTDSVRARLIGYSPTAQLVTLRGGQTVEVNLALRAQAVSLAEIVVTGYGEQRAGLITGAVTQVASEDFNTGRIISPEELIRSKVPGVQVADNNEPGGGLSLRIRGPTSVNASSEPLYVIDGVPVGTGAGGGLSAGRNPLNFLNPNDIETITVLRDASAAAIYGANAANGVVLIRTKTGKAGTTFEYTGSMSSSRVTRLPNMLNAAQFRAAVEQYAPQNLPQLQSANTDWLDLVTRTAFGQEHNAAVSGTSENLNWRLSGGFLDQDGIVEGTTVQRVSLALNLQQRLLRDHLDVRANLKGSRAKDLFTPGGVLSNAAQFGPTQPVFDPTRPTGFYDWPGPGGDYKALTSPDNPLAILALVTDRGTTYRSIGNVQGAYRFPFLEALQAHVDLGYDITRTDRLVFQPSTLHSQQKTGNLGSDYRANQSQSNTGIETYLTYGTPLNVVPGTLDLTGGYSYAWSHAEYPFYQANGLSTDLLGGNGVTSARDVQNVQNIQESRLISFFGRANYNLKDRYLLAASVRRDGSSRFGPGQAWGTFPSVSGGWRISEEPFMHGSGISDLKLRASWAKTGNQAFGNYQPFAAYLLGDAQTQAQFGNTFVPTIRPGAVDKNIKWEETRSYDVGLDFSLLNNRLSGTIDWYKKNTDDLIFTVPVAAGTNLSNFVTTNIGSMQNTGVELSLSANLIHPRRAGSLSWAADFTAAHNTNELTSINPITGASTNILVGGIAGGVGTFIQVLRPGVPVNSFYVFEHIRGADGKPIYEDRQGLSGGAFTGNPDGTINIQDLYVDQNGDNVIDQDDRRPFHSPQPKWMLGHSSYLGYRSFDLSFTLRSYLGNWVYNNVASNLGTYEEVKRGSPYNLHASVLETGFVTPQYLSDFYVEDGSFLRMDNISLGYTFNYRGRPVRLFGTVQNAFTITGYSGVDPTAGLLGIDNNIYPRSRTFTAGLTLRY